VDAMDYGLFKTQVKGVINLDLNSYKEQQMHRRILQWIDRYDLQDFKGLAHILATDLEHRQKFIEYLTINTSHFFRDVAVFKYLEDHILPAIAKSQRAKIWSAGCSIGAEVYTIVMLLLEHELMFQKLHATDIDESILTQAKTGIYQKNQINAVPERLVKRYFDVEDNKYILKDEVKNHVNFYRQNLLTDRFDTGYDLILCRNVFIYFVNEVQKQLTMQFVQSLKPGGYFVVGSAEQIINPVQFGLSRVSYCVYQKQ
jgi:chemotaxis protein methyltransferase CheR